MPAVFRFVAQFVPTTWMVDAARGVILRGAGWAELWPNAVALVRMHPHACSCRRPAIWTPHFIKIRMIGRPKLPLTLLTTRKPNRYRDLSSCS